MKGAISLLHGYSGESYEPPRDSPRKLAPYPKRFYKPREAKRKIPREVRTQLYHLELTAQEAEAEIVRIYDRYGFNRAMRNVQRARIIEERGL